MGVICEKCLFSLPDTKNGKLTIYKAVTVPAESDDRYCCAVEPHGIAVRYVSTDILMETFGNSVS